MSADPALDQPPVQNDMGTHDSDMDQASIDDEIGEQIAGELNQAFDQKDKKAILECIRALVLSCKE